MIFFSQSRLQQITSLLLTTLFMGVLVTIDWVAIAKAIILVMFLCINIYFKVINIF